MENTESNVTNWYYLLDNQQFGPVSSDTIASLLRHHILNAQTMVSSDEGNNWRMLRQTSLWDNFRIAEQDFVSHSSFLGEKQEDEYEKKINGYFYHFWLWTIIGLPLLLIVIGLVPLTVAGIYGCFILFYAWKAIPKNSIGVSPILALVLLFIPFVNCIWCFLAYYYLSREINRSLVQKGDSFRVGESRALVFSILCCIEGIFVFIPAQFCTIYLFIFALIMFAISSVVFIFVLRSIKDGILALHKYEKQTLI